MSIIVRKDEYLILYIANEDKMTRWWLLLILLLLMLPLNASVYDHVQPVLWPLWWHSLNVLETNTQNTPNTARIDCKYDHICCILC